MDKQQWSSRRHPSRQRKGQSIRVDEIRDNMISISYPYNAELNLDLLMKQDEQLKQQYHTSRSRILLLLIKLDGITDIDQACKNYIHSKEHQELYDSIAFVLSKGNMSVLERHYIEQLYSYRPKTQLKNSNRSYSIGVFTAFNQAQRWLESRPVANYTC